MSTPEAVVARALDDYFAAVRKDGYIVDGVDGTDVAAVVIEQLRLTGYVVVPSISGAARLARQAPPPYDPTASCLRSTANEKARATTNHMARFGQSLNPDGSTQP